MTAVIDQLGRQQVLHGPDDMATTYGHVQEQRLNSWAPSWGDNSYNDTDMAKKGYTIPGYKYGGNKLNDMAIIPDTNPYGTGTQYVPVQYQRAQNGMMKNGGYLDFISYPEMPNMNMQHGGPTTNYAPVNQDNASIDFVNDKRGYNQMQNSGHHWTNDGWKKSTGSTNNGPSFSRFGGPGPANGLPAPLEYAYLANGGYVDQYHTGGQMQQGGFAENGPMVYNQTEEMKTGGIHIKPENKGKFTAYKQRTGKTTEEALHSPDPHVRQMANFSRNAAKWHKKEYGGPIDKHSPLAKFIKAYKTGGLVPKMETGSGGGSGGGGGTETSLDAPANTLGPSYQQGQPDTFGNNAYKPTQDTTADVTGYEAPVAPDAGPMPEQGGYEAAQGPATSEGDITTGQPDNTQRLKDNRIARRQAIGQAGTNLLGAGMQAASYFEDQAKQRNMAGYNRQQGMTDNAFAAQKLNTAGSKGDYNQQGVFRSNQNTPQFAGMQYPQMQMGGYKSGGEYELDEKEIARLQKAGYKVQFL
jgi:hypothetical protein